MVGERILDKDTVYYFDPAIVNINELFEKLIEVAKESDVRDIYENISDADYFSFICLFDDFVIDISFKRRDYGFEVVTVPCFKSGLGEIKEVCGFKFALPTPEYLVRMREKNREINDKIQSKLGHLLNIKRCPSI